MFFCRRLGLMLLALVILVSSSQPVDEALKDKRDKLMMREVGHAVLLCMGDQSSRILPIEKEGDRFKLSFSTALSIDPEDIILAFDRVITKNGLTHNLLVEIEHCKSKEVHHIFEVGPHVRAGEIACGGRVLPEDCYALLVTAVPVPAAAPAATTQPKTSPWSISYSMSLMVLVGSLGLLSLMIYRRRTLYGLEAQATDIIKLGDSVYRPQAMTLSYDEHQTSLSHKESRLLQILHESANTTVKREVLLRQIWGDEGHYTGRTLDVFVSKLRKKIEPDARLAIVNARGVGYKLVIR